MRGARGGHNQWAAFVLNEGGRFYDDEGNVTLNEPVVVEAAERYADLYWSGYTPPTAPTDGYKEISGNFEAGVTAMTGHNIGSLATKLEKLGDRLSMIAYPKGAKTGKRWAPLQMNMNGVYKGTEHEEEAISFVLWYAEAETSDVLNREGPMPPFQKSLFDLPYYKEDRFQQACIDSIGDADMVPINEKMGYWSEVLWPQTFQQALMREITIQEMLDKQAEGLVL
jgi:multiple sugar transport system substrate-binding protein